MQFWFNKGTVNILILQTRRLYDSNQMDIKVTVY